MDHVDQDSVDIRQNQISNGVAIMLSDGAIALFAVYVILVFSDTFPPRLLDPTWMMKLALALSVNVPIPLVGLVFLHLSAWLTPMSNMIQARRNFFASLARWAMLGFLLLLPLIGYATYASINAIKIEYNIQKNTARDTTNKLTKFIKSATSPAELQTGLIALKGPFIASELLNTPLPVLKQQSSLIVDQAYKSFLVSINNQNSAQYLPIQIQTTKALLLSLISAVSIAALSWNPMKQQTLLAEFFLGDFLQFKRALNPKRLIANFKLNQEQRSFSKNARLKAQELQKQRQAEAKRIAAANRKQSLERKREMDKYVKEEKRKRSNRLD
jgi:hypothetical protein